MRHGVHNTSRRALWDCVTFSVLQVQHLYVTRYEPIKHHLRPLLGFAF